jgi:hypothetical protein
LPTEPTEGELPTEDPSNCLPFSPAARAPFTTDTALPIEDESTFTITQAISIEDETIAIVVGKQGETTEELITQLAADPNVEYAEPNYLYTLFDIPQDTDFPKLRGLSNTGQNVN